jgi:hypothetical protein
VYPLVPHEVILPLGAVVAVLAQEGPFFSVHHQMPHQATLVTRAVTAVLALVHHHLGIGGARAVAVGGCR